MGLLGCIKEDSRAISDRYAGAPAYFELAATNLSLYRALRAAAAAHLKGRLLDAGAGRMAYSDMLQHGCDSYESLDLEPAEGLDHVADLQDTGLPGGQYDSIFCSQVLHHLPHQDQALKEIARLLKPGGRVVLSVPHLAWLHNEPHDYLRLTSHGIRLLLSQAGLREVAIQPVGGLICFLAYAPSTFCLALLWPIKPLFHLAMLANRCFIRAALVLDKLCGMKALYPTNYVAIAERTAPADQA
jgi:SAM-dependent methyltransferase